MSPLSFHKVVEGAGIEPALRCRTVSDLLHNAMPCFAAASPLGQPPMLCVCLVLKVSELHSGLIWCRYDDDESYILSELILIENQRTSRRAGEFFKDCIKY